MQLADVIAPVTPREFIERHLGSEMLLVSGSPGRFAPLLSWAELNEALNRLRIVGSRLRLMRDGQPVDGSCYLQPSGSGIGSRLKSVAFERCLAEGATLVLDAVDELFPNVGDLAMAFEEMFRVSVRVNLYAGWRTQRGFDLHFDGHDTMVLQLHGRKRWKVYRPTRLHPFRRNDADVAPHPTGEPSWDGVLEDGGVLYMPRGWWHVAHPLDEPSLHLTIGISHATGVQMLSWLLNELKTSVEARMDVPHLKSAAEQQAWIAALRSRVRAACDDGVIQRFMTACDARAHCRPDVHLPEGAESCVTLTPETELRLASGRRLSFPPHNGDGTVHFAVDGRSFTCPAAIVPALERLNHVRSRSLADLQALIPPGLAPALTIFLSAMVMGGAVSARHAARPLSLAGTLPRLQSGLTVGTQ